MYVALKKKLKHVFGFLVYRCALVVLILVVVLHVMLQDRLSVRNILQGKANIEMTTSKYHTPLLVAADNGQTPLIELLVVKGNKLLFDLFLRLV